MRFHQGAVLLQLVLTVSATWIQTAPRAVFTLAGSASAAASASDTPSVIADLRSRKAGELQEDKFGAESLEQDSHLEEDSENEASPSLLKKKVAKILTKLRLIAQLKNAYHYKPEEIEEEDSTLAPTATQPAISGHFSENIQQIPAAASPKISPEDVETLVEPVMVDLKVNQIDDKLLDLKSEIDQVPMEERRSPLKTLGVFFAELIGSIVGLTYGAVAQISAGGQSPVSVSTSEGL